MGGRSSLVEVRHHQFVHDISKQVVCLRFIMISIKGPRENVKKKRFHALFESFYMFLDLAGTEVKLFYLIIISNLLRGSFHPDSMGILE
jgi:hypothetical protein